MANLTGTGAAVLNIYDAIMKAADHIERHPKLFNFAEVWVPDCGTPGCALGWIGHFAGVKHDGYPQALSEIHVPRALTCASWDFYARLESLTGGPRWRNDAAICARGLRLYAAQYHSDEKAKPITAPDWQAMASKWTVGDDVRSQEVARV